MIAGVKKPDIGSSGGIGTLGKNKYGGGGLKGIPKGPSAGGLGGGIYGDENADDNNGKNSKKGLPDLN